MTSLQVRCPKSKTIIVLTSDFVPRTYDLLVEENFMLVQNPKLPSILIVDDEACVCELLRDILETTGYQEHLTK